MPLFGTEPRFRTVPEDSLDIEEAPVRPPAEAGRYERQVCLGRGACGVVYLARDRVIGRTVALKVIEFGTSFSDEVRAEMAARSEREARAAGALNHPNIVTIHDAGTWEGGTSFFIVMEYVEGQTLSSLLDKGPLAPRETVRIGTEIADALEYAHHLGVVHRDVKPANILIRKDGAAKIADFGVARLDSSELTHTGQWVGSPAYMSPEQAQGLPADARSDIFALGVVLYEMLTGSRPFSAETLAGLSYQIIHEEPVPPSVCNPQIDAKWDEVILKAMAKKPQDRYASAADLASDLDALAPGVGGTFPAAMRRPSSPGLTTATLQLEVEPLEPPAAWPGARRISLGRIAAAAAVIVVPGGIILGVGRLQDVEFSRPEPEMQVTFEPEAEGAALAGADGAPAQAPPADVEMATLVLNVIHGLDSGRVEVGVDGRPLWVQSFRAPEGIRLTPVGRKLRGFNPASTTGKIEIPAGRPEIQVSVISDEGSWTQTTSRRIRPGTSATLNVRVRTGRTTGMELKWGR